MTKRILVLNPNSTAAVTQGIDRALDGLRLPGGPAIACVGLAEGPAGIQSQRDVDFVIPHVCRRIGEDNESDAFVIACFSDPGLHSARESTARPVIGISEAGMTTALNLGQRVGVIAILDASIPRHTRYFRAMGIAERIAGELPVNLPVVELSDEGRTRARMEAVGQELKDRYKSDVLVMGCAGMARYREGLQDKLGIPVVDPTQVAVGLAISMVQLGFTPGKAA